MNKYLIVFVAALTALGLTLFAAQGEAAEKKIGLMWTTKSGIATRTAAAFLEKLAEIAPEVNAIQHRQLSAAVDAEDKFRELERQTDGIVFLRSAGAQFLATANPRIPCFVGACTNPAELGVIKNLDAPEGKITGVTYYVPFEKRFEVIKSLFPKITSVALVVETGHPVAPLETNGTREQCQKLGLSYHEVSAGNVRELREGLEKLADKVDLFIAGTTRLAIDHITVQTEVTNKHKKPIFSYSEGRTAFGATAELAADDTKLGHMLAESVFEVVVKGKPIKEVPVKMDRNPELVINEMMVKSLGLSIPESVMKKARLVN